ncbi:unnamed protein product [Lepeophtheirus salmonis]|nr:unnamed protein product [Lepeophtheirus salmonis]CAF2896384.1 unnamed protein product [Lepeophtheirus salmonis]
MSSQEDEPNSKDEAFHMSSIQVIVPHSTPEKPEIPIFDTTMSILNMIREKKEKERQLIKDAQIKRLAMEQKKKMESQNAQRLRLSSKNLSPTIILSDDLGDVPNEVKFTFKLKNVASVMVLGVFGSDGKAYPLVLIKEVARSQAPCTDISSHYSGLFCYDDVFSFIIKFYLISKLDIFEGMGIS